MLQINSTGIDSDIKLHKGQGIIDLITRRTHILISIQEEQKRQLVSFLEKMTRPDYQHTAPDFEGKTYVFLGENADILSRVGQILWNAPLLVRAKELEIPDLERYFPRWTQEEFTAALRTKFERQKSYSNIPLVHFENMLDLDPELYPVDPELIGEIQEYITKRKSSN